MSGNQFATSLASPSLTSPNLTPADCCSPAGCQATSETSQTATPTTSQTSQPTVGSHVSTSLESQQAHHKKLLVCITGSIAAYKSVLLVREAVKAGYQVRVALSQAAEQFVTPLTLQALSQNRVYTSLFDAEAELSMGHIELAKWADCIVIAPATANIIGKIAMVLPMT